MESQTQTRERLLESGKRIFLRDGYVRTSVDKVAEEAGYSKGAVYSNFDGKEALFLELLQRKFAMDLGGLQSLLDHFQNVDDLLAAVRRYYETNAEVLDFALVSAEFLTQIGRGSAFAVACAELYSKQRVAIAALVAALFERSHKIPPAPVEELATALIALTMGLAVQRGANKEAVSPGLWGQAIEIHLRGLLALGGTHGGRTAPRARKAVRPKGSSCQPKKR
jgi:AcrR family transcriptional regulator